MTWVRLDDNFPDHRKLAELGDYAPLCGWLFICGLAFCNRQMTNGRIPKAHVPRLTTFQHIGVEVAQIKGASGNSIAGFGDDIEIEALAEMLVSVRLWEDKGNDYYTVHDYLDFQPSKKQVLAEKAAKIAAGRAGGRATARARARAGATADAQAGGTAGDKAES